MGKKTMKDLSLSLLSRGCGRFISSNKTTGCHDERLDVCFTPQDYYIWKSQDSVLRLSNSGRLLGAEEPTLPKTYSTRRGPLLLYSQDFVTMETKCGSQAGDKKKRVVRRYTQEVEQQLSTLKELTAAILSYSNTQFTSSQLAPSLFPPLHLPPPTNLHCPSTPPLCTTQKQLSQEMLVQSDPQWLPAERKAEQLENQPEDKKEEQGSKRRVRLDLFLQIPSVSRTPTPQLEPQLWVHHVAMTPEDPEEPQTYLHLNLQHTEISQHSEINHDSMDTGGEIHHPNMNDVRDTVDDRGCFIQRDNGTTGIKGNYERSISRNRHGRIVQLYGAEQSSHTEPGANSTSGLLLPPLRVGSSVCHGPCWENTDRPRWDGPSSDEHCVQRLPPIAESVTVAPGWAIQTQTQFKAQTQVESQENQNGLHQQPLLLPLLLPDKKDEEITCKKRGGREKTERQHCKQEARELGGGGRLPSEKGSMILLEPGEEPPPSVGVLGCVAGRRGPGRQSSLAFLQNRLLDLQDPCESSDANRGVVRGVLPLELRDLQNGRSVGSLILGPDGEIIQLSLYDNNQDPSQGDGETQEQALQVLSGEGEELPWVIVLQPEHTHTEGEVELNTYIPAGDNQHHQSIHKHLNLHRSTETDAGSPSSQAHPVAENKKKTKSADTVVGTRKEPKKVAKNSVRMPPLKELVMKPRGGNTEAEEEEEEEQLSSTGKTDQLSGSHQPGEKLPYKRSASSTKQSINLNEATTEDTVEGWRRNTKRNNTGETAITTGKGEVKTGSAEADGQKELKKKKGGKWQRQKTGSDAKPIKSHKQEERTKREAAETQDHTAFPSVKKKMRDREGETGEVKTNERDGRGELARQKEETTGRRRRTRLKHKELVVGTSEDLLEKEELEINQEMDESTRSSFATQRHNDKTNRNSEEDKDHLSTDDNLPNADKHSSIRSASSRRSTVVSQFNQRSSRRSTTSSYEGAVPASTMGLASSRGRLSSCSTVMITEEQLMLNPVKPESSRARRRQEEEEAAALRLAQRAERRRQEVERKRREREEEERKQQEREQTEDRMKSELEEERRKRAEELRLKRLAEEEERRMREEEEQERARREQAERERERRRQEERRRQMERLQRIREEEEQRRKVELERLRLEEEKRQEEESKRLQEMDESERIEYLRRKEQEEEERRNKEEECKRRDEEAALWAAEESRLQAELLTRQMALLQQQLAFKRGLLLEAGGLEKTQGISRPWIYSYFTLLQLMGLNPTKAETTTPDL